MGADEYIERLEGKIRECLFFYVKYSKITVCKDYGVKTWTELVVCDICGAILKPPINNLQNHKENTHGQAKGQLISE